MRKNGETLVLPLNGIIRGVIDVLTLFQHCCCVTTWLKSFYRNCKMLRDNSAACNVTVSTI